jgi:type II secretory pathway predicted ATPase ExeA
VVPLLVLDEAQHFGYGPLEPVRLLLGLNLAESPAFALALIGDEHLSGSLRLRPHRALDSRLACHFSPRPWPTPR